MRKEATAFGLKFVKDERPLSDAILEHNAQGFILDSDSWLQILYYMAR